VVDKKAYQNKEEIAWCPGCGNFSIRTTLQEALAELNLEPHQVLIASGIGQAAKLPHYLKINGFNGLHGRAIPVGTSLAAIRKDLKIIVESGDGDIYGEGGNHFLHAFRRNPNLALFVHNNQVYGLTKGQASPTSEMGMKTGVQVKGVKNLPLNPLLLALAGGATFVARSFAGNRKHLKEMMQQAIQHRGLAFLDILQPCVTFNKINTFQWYKERVYQLGEDHNSESWEKALEKAREWGEKIPTGIFYRKERRIFAEEFPELSREEIYDPRERIYCWPELLENFK